MTGSGNGTDGSSSFTSFETLNLGGGDDTATVNAVASTTITIDGGAGTDTLQVASTDAANNSLTLSGVGGGVLGNVTFLNQEAVSLGSGGDTVLLANGSSLAGSLNLGGGSNTLQIGQVGTGLTSDQATFWTTTDNYSETYLNGTLVGSTNNWTAPFSFNLTGKLLTGNNVIAVASHDAGAIAGMQAQLVGANNSVLFGSSNPGWKFSLTAPSGWQDASFDDSAWSSPTVASQTAGPWGNKMPVNDGSAGWIWSADPNGDDNVYFRYSFNYIPPGTVQDGAVSLGSLSGGAGADTVSLINGIVSGDYNAGDGANTLTISGTASAIGSYQGGSGGDTINLTGGDINGAVTTGAGDDRLVLAASGSSVIGPVDLGSGSGDTLSYAGNSAAATVSLSGANSIGAAGATGIGGTVSGFEVLVGGNGSDSLTAQAGSNSFTVSSGGVVNLDSSLTVSGFETINLGGSADTATLQGGFSGSLDLGAGSDSVTLESGGSAGTIAGGSEADTLSFNASANSVSFGVSGSGSGQSTSFSGFETVNLLAGDDSASFSGAFAGSVNLGDGNDTATLNYGGSTTSLAGGAGTDTLTTSSSANSLILSGADGGSVDGTAFSSFETLNLGSGNDSLTVASGGSLSGNLNLGDDNNNLTFQDGAGSLASVTGGTGSDTVMLQGGSITESLNAGEGTNSLTVSGSNASVGSYQGGSGNDAITLSGGTIFGNVDLGSGSNSLLISSTNSSIGGSVSFGAGSADALSYAGYGTALTLTLYTATSLDATQAPGVMGAVSGFENLTGTSGSDSLNAATGSNSLVVAAGGTTTLDTSLTLNSFESINLGANGDASADTVTLSGNFSGSIDLGAANDTATINGGGANSLDGGTGSDTLNFNGSANSVRIDASGGGSTGSTGFSGFETINTMAGDDTITLGSAATTTQNVDGGDDADQLQVASSDTSNNTLNLSSAGGGTLGGVSFTNIENIILASGSDSVTLASGGGLASRQPGLLADFYNKSGAGVAGSLLRSGVVLGPVNVQDETLQSLVGKSDQVYLFAQGFLTVPGLGSYNDFILSTTSDDGVRVKIDLAGTGVFSNVIDNYTDHADTVNNSSPQSVTAGQRIPIQIEWFESGGGATLELYYQSSSQGIGRTLVPISNLSSSASSSLSGSLDLGAGDDTITFQSGSIGVASLTGGGGTDVLNFASYGSGVSVDLASGTSTGTSGISGFERVIGSSANDTLIASTSDANLLVGNAGDDSFGFTISGLTSADTVQGGTGRDTLVFSTAGTVDESQFSNVSSVEQVVLNGASSFNLGTTSQTVGVDKVFTGSGTSAVSTTIDGYDLAVEANSLANNTSLSLSGSSASNDFVVSNLKGDLVASGTSGSLSVTTGDNTADNTISITIGSGATTITGGAGGDTLSIDAALALENSSLTLAGSSNEVVTNLVGDISATNLSGSLTVTTGDAGDDGISVTTGSANTTINASGTNDAVTVTANAMADNTTLTLSGSAAQSVSNLQANTNASATSGTVNLNYKDVADNAAGITTGSGATSVSGSGSTDTLIINASSLGENTTLTESGTANQTVTNLVGDISATNLSGTLTVTSGNADDDTITITTGSHNTTINASGSGDTIMVNADAMADNTSLTISGSATQTVSNLQANTNASGTGGTVYLSYKDVADNAASITTGNGATSVGGSSDTDTLTVNAGNLPQNRLLSLFGQAKQVVNNLVGNLTGSSSSDTTLSGSLTVNAGDAGDDAIGITTGSGDTTINASGGGDTVTVNADAMADNTSLTLTGSATETVNNLQANVTASGTSGAVTLTYKDVADNAATISTGSGSTSVGGSSNSDTLSINASGLAQNTTLTQSGSANQLVTNLVGDISATNLSGTLNVTTGDAADNGISIATGSGAATITASGTGDTVTTNAAALAQDTTLTLAGTANQTVTNLVGDVAAANSSGTLRITTSDAGDNGINIATGSNNAFFNGTASSDTLSIDAGALAQSSSLNLQGSSTAVVTNLVGDLYGYQAISSQNTETFDTAAGWTNGRVYSNSSHYGNVLGLYASGPKTNGQDTSKTFDLGGQATTLSFDFARIDSWDGEMFRVYIDDSVAFEKSFQYGVSIGNSTGTTGAYSWSIAAKDNLGSYAGVSSWTDQTARISIEIPAGKYNTKIGFGSTLNQVVDDESYAIDNLTVPTSSISNLSGPLTVSTGDALDNAINIVTGSGATTINASGTDDTVTVNADAMADNTSLTITGTASETVNNLQANTNASGSTGVVTLNYKDVADNSASISTGSNDTTINASGAGDTMTVNADVMLDNKTLDINGSASYALTNLEGDLDGLGSSGSLTISYSNVADSAATLKAGSGNVVVTGGDATDTITVTGLSTNNQIFTSQAATSNFSITAGAGSQTITGSNSGNDSIDGGAGSDTLSFAGGSNVVLSITDYGTRSGGVTGQGSDQFSRIESLLGATGTDVLRGIQNSSSNEVLTITGSNSGTMADAAGSGSFAFSSFEQSDLAAGDDVLRITGSGSLSGTADGGAGIDLLDYSAYTASGVEVDLASGKATAIDGNAAAGLVASSPDANSFENVTGSSGDDKIVGDSGANLLLGGGGNDSLDGGSGSDTLNGGSGDDLIEGGSGNDLIIASLGDDTIRGSGGATGSLTPSGEVDRVSYAELGVGFDVSLSGIDGASLKLDNNASLTVAQIIASYNPLTETLSAPSNQLSTDYTQTLSGIQQIVLGDFNDVVRIDANGYLTGASQVAGPSLTLDGGAGLLDSLDYSSFGADSPVYVNLSSSLYRFDVNSNLEVEAEMGDITLVNGNAASHINATSGSSGEGGVNGLSGFEVVIGGAGNDAIVGNDAANILVGNGGNNRLAGGAGDDTIFGGSANDFIIPGSGNDLVLPGAGMNTISVTSSDLSNDQFILDNTALNFFQLEGDGAANFSDNNISKNTFDPGSMGIHILTGGNPVDKAGVTTYDSMEGTAIDDTFNFTSTVLKNIQSISLGTGDDVIFTAPTAKGVTVLYDGGGNTVVGDSLTLNLTFADFRKLNQSGRYTFDLQPYLDDPNSKTLTSTSLDMAASGWEKASVSAVAPGVYNSLPGDPAAFTYNTVFGLSDSTLRSGESLNLSGRAVASSVAEASSANDISSALVQANQVMGAQAVTLDAGTDLSGSSTASHQASASAVTGNNRSDTVLSAYGVGADLSDFSAGRNLSLNLSGSTDGLAKASSIGYIANAAGTVDVVGSSDSSVSAGQNLTLSVLGVASQDVQASNVQGVSLATLASRSAGISDPNLAVSGDSADGFTAGQALTLTARAAATNSVRSQGTTVDQIATLNLVDAGPAADDFLQSALVGDQFPLINGDRIRFSTAGGGVLADRDYWVFNRNAVTGTFQISDQPGGEPVAISANAALGAYRPADALADALASSTAVQLSRSGVGNEALQAGSGLGLNANASQVLTISASSVDGAAAAGLNRVGGFEGMDMATRSLVVAQQATSAAAAGPATLDLTASLHADLEARTVADRADSEANAAVVASDSSSTISSQTLTIKAATTNSLSSTATSTDGSAQARSGAGAGAGTDLAVDLVPDATSAQGGSYGASKGLVNASQQAGGNLAITATASSEQRAVATTVGGSRILAAASASSAGYLLIPNNELADGDPIRLSAAGGTGLSTTTTYRAGSLGFSVELDPTTGIPTNKLKSNSDISYSAGDVIHFRLNSNTAHNDGNVASGRSGITFGTTYYVLGGGTSFEVSTSAGGSPVTLTADTVGSPDTLLDADRIRVLEPVGSGQAYRQAAVSNSAATSLAPITLLQPSTAIALAGGRDADTVLSLADASNSAVVSGIDGQADQAGTIRSLIAGDDASLSGLANGVVTATATNTAGAAIASGSQIAEGLKDMAITSGSDGTITGRGSLSSRVDATTVGMPAQFADALANLNLSATGVAQTLASEAIRIGGNGDVEATASLAGRSTASTVTGNSDALATLQADALRLDKANTINIGDQGSVNATSSAGSDVAPLLVSALSSGVGDATSQMGLEVSGILGNSTAGTFSSITLGGGTLGTVGATGQGSVDVRANATKGASSSSLGSTSGVGIATITGIRNTDVIIAADLAKINATATGLSNLSSQSVAGNATATVASGSFGILSDTGTQVGITVADQGQIAALANQKSVASAISVSGQATSSLSNRSVALDTLLINLGANGQLQAEAVADVLSRAASVSGDV